MKKNLAVLFSVGLLTVFLFPMLAMAQKTPPPDPPEDIWVIVDNVTQWFFGIFMALVVLMVFYSCFMFVTAAGDTDKVTKAREALTYAAVGAVVALLSRAVVPIARTVLGL